MQRLLWLLPILILQTGCASWRYKTVTVDQLSSDMQATEPARLRPLQLASLGSPVSSEIRIHSGDMLDVTVSDLTGENVYYPIPTRVLDDGTVRLPMVGTVALAGMSIPSAEQAIFAAYSSQGLLKKPQVTVILRDTRKIRVYVLGAVNKPGLYDLNATEGDLLCALVSAGGLTPEAGTIVEVRRRLAPGFTPPVPRKDRNIVQAVHQRPSTQESMPVVSQASAWQRNYNLYAQASSSPYHSNGEDEPILAPAQKMPSGVLRPYATPEPALMDAPIQPIPVSTNSQIVRLDLTSELDKQRLTQGFRLENGDTISIDDRKVKPIYVVGMVGKPGEYPLPVDRDLRVLEAIGLAGGTDHNSLPDKALVIRQRPDGSGVVAVRIDLNQAKKDSSQNIRLMAGDTVSVEETAMSFTRGLLRGAVRFGVGASVVPAVGF
jgi:polysaccharide export outer membrane protein